jgi:hypothetical protein
MLCIALRAAFGRLSTFARLSRPSNASQAKKTRNPVGESKKAVCPRCPLGYSPLRGCALACALPYGFLALVRRFLIFSQVLRHVTSGF